MIQVYTMVTKKGHMDIKTNKSSTLYDKKKSGMRQTRLKGGDRITGLLSQLKHLTYPKATLITLKCYIQYKIGYICTSISMSKRYQEKS